MYVAAACGYMASSPTALDAASALHLADSEFVQSFSSPHFLRSLSRAGSFADASFLSRLRGLHARWTSSPELLATLRFPVALEFLRLASESAAFRAACAEDAFIASLNASLFGHWSAGSPPTGLHATPK